MKELPSEDEVRRSGTGDWLDQAMQAQERKNKKLANMIGGDAEAVRREKAKLASIWDAPAGEEEEEVDKGPDLFANEREQARQSRASLAGMFGAETQAKEKENEELRGLFGFNPKPSSPKKRK